MPVKFNPSELSRDEVQVVLRTSTSTSPDCSAVKRSLADSGTNFTFVTSLKIAAAIARHRSTSSPVQLPCASGRPNPASVPLAPQLRMPRSLTVLSVCADALCATTRNASAMSAAIFFIDQPPSARTRWCGTHLGWGQALFYTRRARSAAAVTQNPGLYCPSSPRLLHSRTNALQGQGVDAH